MTLTFRMMDGSTRNFDYPSGTADIVPELLDTVKNDTMPILYLRGESHVFINMNNVISVEANE